MTLEWINIFVADVNQGRTTAAVCSHFICRNLYRTDANFIRIFFSRAISDEENMKIESSKFNDKFHQIIVKNYPELSGLITWIVKLNQSYFVQTSDWVSILWKFDLNLIVRSFIIASHCFIANRCDVLTFLNANICGVIICRTVNSDMCECGSDYIICRCLMRVIDKYDHMDWI